MAREIETDNPRVLMIGDVAVNTVDSGHLGKTSLAFTTFLCDKCDRTHIVIQCEVMDEQFNMALDPKLAEKFANMLTNPRLVDPNEHKK